MFTKEETESWNELFPDCKIRDNDLLHPTEAFLTKALAAYLRYFGYKVNPPFALNSDTNENTREKRQFLIMLTRHIDRLLKITDKSYTFTYLDLIRPTPKKTLHMLSILLNYLYYHNMYKTKVFKMAKQVTEEHKDLKDRVTKMKKECEQRKKKAEQMKKESKILNTQLPLAKGELKKLNNQCHKQKECIQNTQNELTKQSVIVEDLKDQMRKLEIQVVTDQEANELKKQYSKLQHQSTSNEESITTTESYLKERKKEINVLEKVVEDVKNARNVLPDQLLIKFKSITKSLKESKKQSTALENKREEYQQELEQKQSTLEEIESQYNGEKGKSDAEFEEKLEEISEKEELCNKNIKLLKYKQEEEHALECLLEEQTEIKKYIQENVEELMHSYCNNT